VVREEGDAVVRVEDFNEEVGIRTVRMALSTPESNHLIVSAAVSSDGRFVATAEYDGNLMFWDMGRNECCHECKGDGRVFVYRGQRVRCHVDQWCRRARFVPAASGTTELARLSAP
jgi:WD40 repeat protein